jgi:membrane fusion protein, multidrug efflux system
MNSTPIRAISVGGTAFLATVFLNLFIVAERHAPSVPVVTVRAKPMPLIIRASGKLMPKRALIVTAPFDSTILSKTFREGQEVQKDEALIELDRHKIRMAYQAKEAALKSAQADVLQAKREVKLQKTLFQRQAVAYSAIEEAEAILMRANQALQDATNAFHLETEKWQANIFKSPFAGKVVKDFIQGSKEVTQGQNLLTLADLSGYTMVASIDEMYLTNLKQGLTAEVTLQAYPDATFSGLIGQVGASPENNSGAGIAVHVDLQDQPGKALLPGLNGHVRIVTGETEPTMAVPLTAIDNTNGENIVWEVSSTHQLKKRIVVLGRITAEEAEIVKGIEEGTVLCRTVSAGWRENLLVKTHD